MISQAEFDVWSVIIMMLFFFVFIPWLARRDLAKIQGVTIDWNTPETRAMLAAYPKVTAGEMAEMEKIIDEVIANDLHPDMRRILEDGTISLALLDEKPTIDMVKRHNGYVPRAVFRRIAGGTNQINIYAAAIKRHCGGDRDAYRMFLGKILMHEVGHFLGLSEDEVRAYRV